MVRLVAAHGVFALLIPACGNPAAEVALANQRLLNRQRPLGIDFLLTPRLPGCSPGAAASRRGWRFLMFANGGSSCRRSCRLRRRGVCGRSHRQTRAQQGASANCAAPPNGFRHPLSLQPQPPSNLAQAYPPAVLQQTPTASGTGIILHSMKQCQFRLAIFQVTEVYRRRRRCHPGGLNRAAGPGKPRPGHSSDQPPLWRIRPRCSPTACSLRG